MSDEFGKREIDERLVLERSYIQQQLYDFGLEGEFNQIDKNIRLTPDCKAEEYLVILPSTDAAAEAVLLTEKVIVALENTTIKRIRFRVGSEIYSTVPTSVIMQNQSISPKQNTIPSISLAEAEKEVFAWGEQDGVAGSASLVGFYDNWQWLCNPKAAVGSGVSKEQWERIGANTQFHFPDQLEKYKTGLIERGGTEDIFKYQARLISDLTVANFTVRARLVKIQGSEFLWRIVKVVEVEPT